MKILQLINLRVNLRVNYVQVKTEFLRCETRQKCVHHKNCVICINVLKNIANTSSVCKLVENNEKKQPKQIDAEGIEAKTTCERIHSASVVE